MAALAAYQPALLARFAKDIALSPTAVSSVVPVADRPAFSIHPIDVGPVSPTDVVITLTPDPTPAPTAPPTATQQQPASGSADGPRHDDKNKGECELLGPFALLVQLGLGALALLSLVYKRWRERPQRPVKIWFFDASKQVFGSVLVHIVNVFMSMLTSGSVSIKVSAADVATTTAETVQRVLLRRAEDEYIPNPCSFYLLNLAIDTTIGIPILIVLLRILTGLALYTPFGNPPESIRSGNYGTPPNAWWWLKQSFIYFGGLFLMKVCVLVIFLVLPWISRVGDWALGWTEGNEKLQIIFVMMLFPLIMNAMQYYIIDSFIKQAATSDSTSPTAGGHRPVDAADSDDDDDNEQSTLQQPRGARPTRSGGGGVYDRLSDQGEDDGSDESELGDLPPKRAAPTVNAREAEYDPERDGDSPTVVGSSASARAGGKLLPKELYPHE